MILVYDMKNHLLLPKIEGHARAPYSLDRTRSFLCFHEFRQLRWQGVWDKCRLQKSKDAIHIPVVPPKRWKFVKTGKPSFKIELFSIR